MLSYRVLKLKLLGIDIPRWWDERLLYRDHGFPDERVTIIVLRNYEVEIYDRLEIELAEMVLEGYE